MEKSVFGFFVSFAGINPRLIPFRIFCFFLRKESRRVILRNNPILDFTKEMHPKCSVLNNFDLMLTMLDMYVEIDTSLMLENTGFNSQTCHIETVEGIERY